MKVGDILVWDTGQAIGYALRRKYHVYICEAGWRADGHAFLFVSSVNYGCDYQISNTDYTFLSNNTSFLSCGNIVTYTEGHREPTTPRIVADRVFEAAGEGDMENSIED